MTRAKAVRASRTTYTRDADGGDEAMMRRYNRWHLRFDRPDPYDGSYDFADPQSFNRYAYADNDPANLTDPSGLMPNLLPQTWGAGFGVGGFGGRGGGRDMNDRPMRGRGILEEGERRSDPFRRWAYYWWSDIGYGQELPYTSAFAGREPWGGRQRPPCPSVPLAPAGVSVDKNLRTARNVRIGGVGRLPAFINLHRLGRAGDAGRWT